MLFLASALTASADVPKAKSVPQPIPVITSPQPQQLTRAPRFFSFRSLALQVDNQVIANLLADSPARGNAVSVMVHTGDIARCELTTCQVPMSVRVEGAKGPLALTFAVANPKGELSEPKHAECNIGDCVVSLILERGQNTISIGVLDGIAQATGFTTVRVNANRAVAAREPGRAEWF